MIFKGGFMWCLFGTYDLLYAIFVIFLKKLNYLSRASHHYHVRSKFTSFHFALMVSITDEKYDVAKYRFQNLYDNINVTKYYAKLSC